MKVTVEITQAQLPMLIDAALRGEQVIISRGLSQSVRLEPVAETKFKVGSMKGLLGIAPDFFEPVSWDGF